MRTSSTITATLAILTALFVSPVYAEAAHEIPTAENPIDIGAQATCTIDPDVPTSMNLFATTNSIWDPVSLIAVYPNTTPQQCAMYAKWQFCYALDSMSAVADTIAIRVSIEITKGQIVSEYYICPTPTHHGLQRPFEFGH
jgi:hypothetical protein